MSARQVERLKGLGLCDVYFGGLVKKNYTFDWHELSWFILTHYEL